LIDKIKQLAEYQIWGDQNDESLFE